MIPLDVVLVAYNDNTAGNYSISIARSVDGGVNFAPAFAFNPAVAIGDSVLAVGPVPAVNPPPCGLPGPPPPPPPIYLAFVTSAGSIGLSVSNNGGLNWGPVMNMSPGLAGFQDKPWLDFDLQTGTAYVCWTRITQDNGEYLIRMSSTDGLYTNHFVSDPPNQEQPHIGAQGCQVKVDPVLEAAFLAWFQAPVAPVNQPGILFRPSLTTVAACGPIRHAGRNLRPIGAPVPARPSPSTISPCPDPGAASSSPGPTAAWKTPTSWR